jgi:hypothetical protein
MAVVAKTRGGQATSVAASHVNNLSLWYVALYIELVIPVILQ